MSGRGETGDFYAANEGGLPSVQQKDIDQYYNVQIQNPSVSTSWFGTVTGGTAGTNNALTQVNALADWPRNAFYTILGVASGTFGGTFTANWIDQFGSPVQEKVVVASAAPAVGVYGSVIVAKFVSGTFASQGSSGGSTGTAQIGFGTLSNGSAQSNWFGLLTKVGGTSDLKLIRWVNNGTATTLNGGTSIGSLINTTLHGFQGTSGVQITDTLDAFLKPSFDNVFKGVMTNL